MTQAHDHNGMEIAAFFVGAGYQTLSDTAVPCPYSHIQNLVSKGEL
jgi:hypothetical protein